MDTAALFTDAAATARAQFAEATQPVDLTLMPLADLYTIIRTSTVPAVRQLAAEAILEHGIRQGVDQMAQRMLAALDRKPAPTVFDAQHLPERRAFFERCRRADWHCGMADDMEAYRAGGAELEAIITESRVKPWLADIVQRFLDWRDRGAQYPVAL